MISVIIPTYNRAKTIGKAIDSVLNQTYKDIELIVVDDGSTDNTKEIVQQYEDFRIKYIWQANKGACAARNHGIDVAKGEFIAFQDSDDSWDIRKLEKQLHIFELYPEIDIVCCKTKCKKLNGSILLPMKDVPEGIIDKKTGPFGISTQSIIIRRCVAETVRFDLNVLRYQDLDFLLTAQERFQIYCMNDYLVERTIGADSITNHPERVYLMAKYFEKKYPNMFRKNNRLPKFLSSALIEAAGQITNRMERKKYFKKALVYNNSLKMCMKILFVKLNIYFVFRRIIEKIELQRL